MRHSADRLDVDHLHQRVRGRLNPHHFRVVLDGVLQQSQVTGVDKLRLHAQPFGDGAEQSARSTVEIVRHQHMISCTEHRHNGGGGTQARRKSHSKFAIIQTGQTLLQHIARGVATAAVLKALVDGEEEDEEIIIGWLRMWMRGIRAIRILAAIDILLICILEE